MGIKPTSIKDLRYFTTPEHECSYLEGKRSTTLFADPEAIISTELYSMLSSVGFRRSGQHIYRPHCQDCSACVPVRVAVNHFKKNRKQNRIWRKNQDLEIFMVSPEYTDENYSIFDEYITERHTNGDMYPADPDQFRNFLVNGRPEATFCEFRENGKLVAVCVADVMVDGLSAIYTFFSPEKSRRSLGNFAVLWLIEAAIKMNKPYVYLGYWIKDCQKMNYKTDYRPIELYYNDKWQLLK